MRDLGRQFCCGRRIPASESLREFIIEQPQLPAMDVRADLWHIRHYNRTAGLKVWANRALAETDL